jgi:hypothetical protein
MWVSGVGGIRRQGEDGPEQGVSQGYHGDQGRFGGSESGIHAVRQPGVFLRVTCECDGARLEDPGESGEETAVEVNHTLESLQCTQKNFRNACYQVGVCTEDISTKGNTSTVLIRCIAYAINNVR